MRMVYLKSIQTDKVIRQYLPLPQRHKSDLSHEVNLGEAFLLRYFVEELARWVKSVAEQTSTYALIIMSS